MFFEKLFKPAFFVLKKLPFKIKVIAAISLLFILLILPARNMFVSYFQERGQMKNKLIGLQYNRHIYALIYDVQLHRGFSDGYLNGNHSFKKDILLSEKRFSQKVSQLLQYDLENLNLLVTNQDFIKAIGEIELVKYENIKLNYKSLEVFEQHTEIVLYLITTLQNIAKTTSFNISDDLSLYHISNMLEDKLLFLGEYTAQTRGLATGIFAKKEVSKEEKMKLLSFHVLIQTYKSHLENLSDFSTIENYEEVNQKIKAISDSLYEMQRIINTNIILSKKPSYESEKFFKKATVVLDMQVDLYENLSKSYQNATLSSKQKKEFKLATFIALFSALFLALLYLFIAFYFSVVKSLKKLQYASELISSGEKNIHIVPDSKDEIGDAILAFNEMSQKLSENITFLDGYKMAIDETSIVSKTDEKGIITYVNKMFCEISGYKEEELIGQPHSIIRHSDMPKDAFKELWQTIKDGRIWKGVVKNSKKNGGHYIVDATIIPIVDSDGNFKEYVGVRHDITELEDSKEEIKKQKTYLLTKLPNRNQLLEDLKFAKKPILFYLNIDNFSNLNDFYGTKIGDSVLIHLANHLEDIAIVKKYKTYKLNADGYILLFEDENLTKESYRDVFEDIIDCVEKNRIDCDLQNRVSITVSGGASFHQQGIPNENLIVNANTARKVAQVGDNKFLVYDSFMQKDDSYLHNITWVNMIKNAILEDRFVTFFQPIIDNNTGKITKYEALVRIKDNNDKIISPFFFLEIAKKAKLYSKITKIVLDKTFETFENRPELQFSINLSMEDINSPETTGYIYKKLKTYPHTNQIIFEITESEEIKDYESIKRFIKIVKNYGVKIAIDDFGSGYANFKHILDLEADFIKIDGSLIKEIDTDENSQIITEAIIAFSKKLGRQTIVEFVHNEKVYEKVKLMGADCSQGYYLGEPKPMLV